MTQMNLSIEQKQVHRHIEQTVVSRRKGEERGVYWEFGVGRCKLLHLEWVNNRSHCIAQGTVFHIL